MVPEGIKKLASATSKSEDKMAIGDHKTSSTDPRGPNAPNKVEDGSKNLGGKTEINKTEGGTRTEEEKQADDKRNREDLLNKLGADKLSSISQEDSDKLGEGNWDKETETEDGRTVLTNSVSQEEASKINVESATAPVNFTQNLTGVPGNVDLTQGGRLSGDKSVRVQRTIEDINEELEKTSGPNPAPNREGNEISKATQNVMGQGYVVNTGAIADTLKGMLKKNRFDDKDREKLTEIEKQLRTNTKIA